MLKVALRLTLFFVALFAPLGAARAHVHYYFHYGSPESLKPMLERAGPQGRFTPELFELLDGWYYSSQYQDRAGPGFYMASEPFSSRIYGTELVVVRVDDPKDQAFPQAGEEADAIKLRVENAIERDDRNSVPLIGRYRNHRDVDWYVISRPTLPEDTPGLSFFRYDENLAPELRLDIDADVLERVRQMNAEQQLRLVWSLQGLFRPEGESRDGNPLVVSWLRELGRPLIEPAIQRGLREMSELDSGLPAALRQAIFSLHWTGAPGALEYLREFFRKATTLSEKLGKRPWTLRDDDFAAQLAYMAKKGDGAWGQDPQLRELIERYLRLPSHFSDSDMLTEGIGGYLEIASFFGVSADLESVKKRLSFESATGDTPLLWWSGWTALLGEHLFSETERREIDQKRAERLWAALEARSGRMQQYWPAEVVSLISDSLLAHLKRLSDPNETTVFLEANERRLLALKGVDLKAMGLAAMVFLSDPASNEGEEDLSFAREKIKAFLRRELPVLLSDPRLGGMFNHVLDSICFKFGHQTTPLDIVWELVPEARAKLFPFYYYHFTRRIMGEHKATPQLFEEPKLAYERLLWVLRQGQIPDMATGRSAESWLKRAALPVEGSAEYSELARLFTLVDPVFVSEDLRLMNATSPQHRFNENYYEDGQEFRQSAWESHGLAWFYLAGRLNRMQDWVLENTMRILMNGGVEGSHRSELYEIVSKKAARAAHLSEIDPRWLMSKKRYQELSRFFVLQERGDKAYLQFKSTNEILAAFPGIRKYLAETSKSAGGFNGPALPRAIVQWIVESVSHVRDPVRRAARILHLLPKLHPYRNLNGRLARLWASLELIKAGYAVPVGLPTYDFGLTEEDLYWEVRKSLRIGQAWIQDLRAAHAEGIPAAEYFQRRFRGSALEGYVNWHASSPTELKKDLQKGTDGPDSATLPEWSPTLARHLDDAFYFLHEKGGRLAHWNEEERRRRFAELRRNAGAVGCRDYLEK